MEKFKYHKTEKNVKSFKTLITSLIKKMKWIEDQSWVTAKPNARNSLDKQNIGYDGLTVDYTLNSETTLDLIKQVLKIDIRPEFEKQVIADVNKHGQDLDDDFLRLPKSQDLSSIRHRKSKTGFISNQMGDENSSQMMSDGFKTFLKIKDMKFTIQSSSELMLSQQSYNNDQIQVQE